MGEKSKEFLEFFRDVENVPDNLLLQWVERLECGERNTEAEGLSRAILRDFAMRVWLSRPQSEITLRWLAEALDQITDYANPYDVLVLAKRAPNRPAGHGVDRAIDVACWVALALDRGYSEPEANALAAATFFCDERSIRRMREKAKGWPESMNKANWDEYFSLRKRPLPLTKAPDAKS